MLRTQGTKWVMALKKTILYIDDDLDSVPLVRWALASLAKAVLWAGDGASGLEMACAHRPDLVLLDLDLPGMDGYAVAEHLRELVDSRRCWPNGAGIPIIALTANASPEAMARAHAAGVDRCVAKPVDARELWRQAAALLAN
jgi:CheY-like chemotaxis protein